MECHLIVICAPSYRLHSSCLVSSNEYFAIDLLDMGKVVKRLDSNPLQLGIHAFNAIKILELLDEDRMVHISSMCK